MLGTAAEVGEQAGKHKQARNTEEEEEGKKSKRERALPLGTTTEQRQRRTKNPSLFLPFHSPPPPWNLGQSSSSPLFWPSSVYIGADMPVDFFFLLLLPDY